MSLFINGVRTAQRGIDIPAGGSAEAEFASAPMRPGFASGMAELEDDDLEFDNRRYFSLFIPSEIRVLCVGTPADVAYVEMALSARLADTLQFVRPDRVGADRITRASLMAQDVIVLCDPGPLSAESSAAVAEFVRNGGGMILFPGLRTDPRSYSVSFGALSLPAIVGIDRAVAPGGGAALPFTFGRVDWQHPIFQRMFESDRGKTTLRSDGSGRRPLESPDVRTTMRFLPGPHSSVVIELSNGAPFLIDQPAGNGRSLLFSVPATRSWSDLPTRGIFVTALHRAVLYAARKTHDAPPVNAGDPARITLQEASAPHASVTDPGGVRSDLPLTRTANGLVLALPSTDRPGLYRIQAGGNVEDLVAVNVDARESALAAAGESRLEGLFRRLGIEPGAVTTVGSGERLTRAVLDARIGTELWRLFLVLALVTALAETAVARDSRRALADIKHEMTGQVT